jgi:hypothetical protein
MQQQTKIMKLNWSSEGEKQQGITNKKAIPQKEVAKKKQSHKKKPLKKPKNKKEEGKDKKKIFSWLYVG